MIKLSYICKGTDTCMFHSQQLFEAQAHADASGHEVFCSGSVIPDTDAKTDTFRADSDLARKVKDEMIIRAARDRGLI